MQKCLTDKLVQLHHLTDGDIKIQKDVPVTHELMAKLEQEFKSLLSLEDLENIQIDRKGFRCM